MVRAASLNVRNVFSVFLASVGLTRTAMRAAWGTSWYSSSSRLASNSLANRLIPVRFSVGLVRLFTRPRRVGSSPTRNTTGIVAVAALAANAAGGPPDVTITAERKRTNSAANSGKSSVLLSPHRYSILTLSPSTNPTSFSPWRNAATRLAIASDDLLSRKPTIGIVADCCACAASGHAAAPSPAMNARRFIRSPRRRGRVAKAEH